MMSSMIAALGLSAQALAHLAAPASSDKAVADDKKYLCLGDPSTVPGLVKECELALLDVADMGRGDLGIKGDSCMDLSDKFGCIVTVCNYYTTEKVIILDDYIKAFEETLLPDCAEHGQDGRWTPDHGPLDRVDPTATKENGIVMILEIHGDDADSNDDDDADHDHDHDDAI